MLAELVIREVDRREPRVPAGGNHPKNLVHADPATGYSLRPGFEGIMRNPWGDFSEPVAIDSLGNRDAPGSAPTGIVILGIGDSFTYGEGVPIDSTYLGRIERELSGPDEVRVVKGGVPGYSALQMKQRLEVLAPLVQPDIVIVGLVPSAGDRLDDPFVACEGYLVRTSYRPQLELVGDELFASPASSAGARRFDTYLQAASHLYRRIVSIGRPRSFRTQIEATDEIRARWMQDMVDLAEEMHAATTSIDARLVLVLIDSPPRFEQPIIRECRRLGVPVIPTARARERARQRGIPTEFAHDDHWTSEFHGVVAELVLEEMRSSGILAAP